MSQKPSVGRVVHYVARGSLDGAFPPVCRAAIVTEVPDDVDDVDDPETLGLAVLNPTGVFFDRTVVRDEDGERRQQAEHYAVPDARRPATYELCGAPRIGGTWHWPGRV